MKPNKSRPEAPDQLNPGGYVFVGQNEKLEGLKRVEGAPVVCYRKVGPSGRDVPEVQRDESSLASLDADLETIQQALGELDDESFDSPASN